MDSSNSINPCTASPGSVESGIRLEFTKCKKNIRNFRCLLDIKALSDPKIVKTGVDSLSFSGSGQFGADNLRQLALKVEEIKGKKIEKWVIDLRAEPHVFINKRPAVWKADHLLNHQKTAPEVILNENSRIADIGKTALVWERKGPQVTVQVESVSNEQQIVEKYGFFYLRVPISDDHRPDDLSVDILIDFILTHLHAWLHAHCYAGKGRATTVLAMIDMLHNAHLVSFEDILYRQKAIGGADLTKLPPETDESYPLIQARLSFLKDFYAYCKEVNPKVDPQKIKWTEWLARKRNLN